MAALASLAGIPIPGAHHKVIAPLGGHESWSGGNKYKTSLLAG